MGERTTPSYVAFTENGERLVGDAAKNQITKNPHKQRKNYQKGTIPNQKEGRCGN